MSFFEGSSFGSFNGSTDVVAVAAPQEGVCRVIRNVILYNADDVSVTFRVSVWDGAVETPLYRAPAMGVAMTYRVEGPLVLDSITKTLQVRLEAPANSTEPTFCVNYADCG